MINYSIALVLLAAAIPLASRAKVPRIRLAWLNGHPVPGSRVRCRIKPKSDRTRRLLRRARHPPRTDPMTVAATWDLLAACLRAGLPVPTAITAVADELPTQSAQALRASADLLALGADPDTAWSPATSCLDTAALARGARRAAQSGTALADLATDLATTVRANAADTAEATAQRAGVLIVVPLGVCFLPAFICLGIAPVIVGLARQIAL